MIKEASALAKEKKFNEAIDVLIEFYKHDFASDADLIKIIPYFQKSGRYNELPAFCKKVIIPKLKVANNAELGHRCADIQNSFLSLKYHKLYKKLALCAKRNKCLEDESEYKKLSDQFYKKYENFLATGSEIEDLKEYQEAVQLFGADTSKWPENFRERFSKYINR
jgi:hypothetical protein